MKEYYNKNKRILQWIYEIQEWIHKQDEIRVISLIEALANSISGVIAYVVKNRRAFEQWGFVMEEEYVFGVLERMLDAQEQKDYILYGDLLKLQILPILTQIQEAMRNSGEELLDDFWEQNMKALKEKDMVLYQQMLQAETLHSKSSYAKDVYSIEDTTVGDLTVAVAWDNRRIYLHSNENPAGDAKWLIEECYDAYKEQYLIYGIGLGYHCRYLAAKDVDIQITILENDIGMLQLAMTYTDMSWYFHHSGVKIYYDPEWQHMKELLEDMESVVPIFHRPSVRRIREENILEKLEACFVHEGSLRVHGNRMIRNYLYNVKHCCLDITELQEHFRNKTVIIVGAGPSLDINVHLLKEKPENVIILAMGAVYRKLYQMGINVDYIIITDSKVITDGQILGCENTDVPMILLSTATKGVTKMYKGKKYMLCQRGFADAEQLAVDNSLMLFETGGSVATTAIDMCIRFQADRIVLVGLDLAYTGNKNHAAGARDEGITDYSGMIMVEEVHGGQVPTTRPFLMYREWIERRIVRKDVTMPIFDATEGGAKIEGTIICRLEDVLKDSD